MKASIVIATHRRNDLLKWNLWSLVWAHKEEGVEILVMDDSHERDEGCEALANEYGCIYIHSGRTKDGDVWRIPGFAFNIGAKLAQGEVLVLSCAEVYHPLNTLKAMLSVMEDNTIAIPKCIRDDKGGVLGQLLQNLMPETKSIERLRALDATLPFFMGMKRQRFLDIGGYDEDFTGVCWDDNDITERLILSGGKYHVVPMDVVHLTHPRHNYRSAAIMTRWNYNKALYDKRRGQIVRNQGKEWGVLS
jgi:GT2 family glycosyltransferase